MASSLRTRSRRSASSIRAAELGQFRDRVAVLERIATENDRSLLLDREIEKLRRQPAE